MSRQRIGTAPLLIVMVLASGCAAPSRCRRAHPEFDLSWRARQVEGHGADPPEIRDLLSLLRLEDAPESPRADDTAKEPAEWKVTWQEDETLPPLSSLEEHREADWQELSLVWDCRRRRSEDPFVEDLMTGLMETGFDCVLGRDTDLTPLALELAFRAIGAFLP